MIGAGCERDAGSQGRTFFTTPEYDWLKPLCRSEQARLYRRWWSVCREKSFQPISGEL